MSRLSPAVAAVGALALSAAGAPSALAADTTPPSLAVSVGGNSFAGVATILNSGGSTSFGGQYSAHITVSGPGISAKSSEDGTITFTLRDAFTGARKRAVTVPATAGQRVSVPTGDENDPNAPSLLPVKSVPCGGTGWCGVKHRLPIFSLLRIDAQAADAAGNRSATRSNVAIVLPDLIIPVAY